ncbi:MAG: hypothetical protein GPJ51_11185 [Candidatus Heimdallarchaeota archaeon]|nr:hypothetical protein [Candidatus Heimdallarchaeota archaeon]
MNISELDETKCMIRINRRSSSASMPDINSIIEKCDNEEDDRFWYVIFQAITPELEELYELTGGWKSTKLWVYGKEIPKSLRWRIRSIIFCNYRDDCEGVCMHDLGMNLHSYNYTDILLEEKIGKNESIKGLKKWFEEMGEEKKGDSAYRFRACLKSFIDSQVIKIKNNESAILDKEQLKEVVKNLYNYELEYCPSIVKEKTIDIIDQFPNTTMLPIRFQKELQMEQESEEGIDEDEEEWEQKSDDEYLRKQAEFFGEEVEKRMRKVLSEFFNKK